MVQRFRRRPFLPVGAWLWTNDAITGRSPGTRSPMSSPDIFMIHSEEKAFVDSDLRSEFQTSTFFPSHLRGIQAGFSVLGWHQWIARCHGRVFIQDQLAWRPGG